MVFTLEYNNISESRDLPDEYYTIKDLIMDLGLSTQTVVSKQNDELVIEDTIINDGDEIKLIQIIYGG